MRRAVRTETADGMTDSVGTLRTEDRDVIAVGENEVTATVTTNKQVQESTLRKNSKEPSKPNMHNDDLGVRIIGSDIDKLRCRYPFCIVWTPLPLLTWMVPIIGHMGICYSSGIIRDFAGPYYVSEDAMAFGSPTKYWILNPELAQGGRSGWDRGIYEASEEYKTRMHNIVCDNCHSHCAYALNLMNYKGSKSWNMVWLAWFMLLYGKYVSFPAFLKTWGPFLIFLTVILVLSLWRF